MPQPARPEQIDKQKVISGYLELMGHKPWSEDAMSELAVKTDLCMFTDEQLREALRASAGAGGRRPAPKDFIRALRSSRQAAEVAEEDPATYLRCTGCSREYGTLSTSMACPNCGCVLERVEPRRSGVPFRDRCIELADLPRSYKLHLVQATRNGAFVAEWAKRNGMGEKEAARTVALLTERLRGAMLYAWELQDGRITRELLDMAKAEEGK